MIWVIHFSYFINLVRRRSVGSFFSCASHDTPAILPISRLSVKTSGELRMHWDTHGSGNEGCPLKCWALFMCIYQHLFFLSTFPLKWAAINPDGLAKREIFKTFVMTLHRTYEGLSAQSKLIFFLVTWTIPWKRRDQHLSFFPYFAVPRQLLGYRLTNSTYKLFKKLKIQRRRWPDQLAEAIVIVTSFCSVAAFARLSSNKWQTNE